MSLNIFAQSNREVKEKPLEIVLGIDRIIQLDFAASTKIQVGNESILTYQIIPQKREITFKGIKPGKTSVIIRNTVVNNNVCILDGCVIGKKGFGFFPDKKTNYRYPQIGSVIINENSYIIYTNFNIFSL